MPELNITEPDGKLYIVTDSHLDENIAPASQFVEMLGQLENPHTVVFLGDLFVIWLAPPKFWTEMHRTVMSGFQDLKDRGCNVVFIAGNRDMLLPRKFNKRWQTILPFTHFIYEDWYLNWGQKRFGFIHGDTINYNDHQYLRWKALSRNLAFEAFFRIIPAQLAAWIAESLEAKLADTNKEFKIHFPEKEMKEFADSVLPDVDQYFVGHFHLDKLIEVDGCTSVLRVIPDWLSQRTVLRVSEHGEIEILLYQNSSLGNLH